MFTITDLMLGGKRVGYRLNLVDTKLKNDWFLSILKKV